MTPLHLATQSGDGPIVQKLLLKGCDRTATNNLGMTALDIAREC